MKTKEELIDDLADYINRYIPNATDSVVYRNDLQRIINKAYNEFKFKENDFVQVKKKITTSPEGGTVIIFTEMYSKKFGPNRSFDNKYF